MRFRLAVVATLLFVAIGASEARMHRIPVPSPPDVLVVSGYLDRAPAAAKVVDRVDITAQGQRTRWLLVTSYRNPGEVMLSEHLSRSLKHPWSVQGKRADVSRLFSAPVGTKVEAKFLVYRRGYPSLAIAELTSPAEAKVRSEQ